MHGGMSCLWRIPFRQPQRVGQGCLDSPLRQHLLRHEMVTLLSSPLQDSDLLGEGPCPLHFSVTFWQSSTWHIAVQEYWQDGWMTVIRTGRLQWRAYPACAVYSGILGLVQVCSQSIGKPFLCHKVGWIKQWKQEQRMQEEIGRDS